MDKEAERTQTPSLPRGRKSPNALLPKLRAAALPARVVSHASLPAHFSLFVPPSAAVVLLLDVQAP